MGTFYEETGKRLKTTSQLNLFNILEDNYDKTKFLNIFKSYTINTNILNNTLNYYVYEVGQNEWLENISYKFYKTVDFWWIIAIMNDIINPFEELTEGNQLKILKQNFIYQVIKDIDNISRL